MTETRIMEVLMELNETNLQRVAHILNTKELSGRTIPSAELKNLDANKLFDLLKHYHSPEHMAMLMEILDAIPRKDLAHRLSGDKERSKFTLSDLEAYATSKRNPLMQRLEERFEPKAMSELKEQLAKSILKNAFSFTAQKAQKLYTNQNLKSFLNITGDEKFKKIPQIILDTLFSIDKSNNKREAEVKENIQKETLLKENKPTSSSLAGSTGDCELEIVHENNKETQQNLGIKCAKEADDTEMSKITAENRQSNKEGLQKPVVKYAKDADKMMAEQGPYEKLLLPISKWIKKKREKYHNKNFHLDPIGVREHETYSCFVAEDILRFTYPEDIILRILQDNKYLTSGRKLKKNVEFELQFNMAVLGVKRSEITSPVGDFIVEADCTFAQFEIFFKKVVFEIVLPVLALHNCVKLDVIRKAFIC